MRLATWNVNGLRARLDFVALWLEARRPDVVGLQELKLSDEQFPHAEFERLGYHAVLLGQKAWNGVAILSRQPATVRQSGLPGQEAFGARLITAEVAGLSFTTVYCPNGKSVDHTDFPCKLAWFDDLARHLEEARTSSTPRVVCGDFNICPTALDSYDEARLAGTVFHTEAERGRYAGLLATGLCDLYRKLHPTVREYSWWDYRGGAFHRGHGLRIDLMLATSDLGERLATAEIDRDWRKKHQDLTPSDHAPVFVDLH